MVVLYTLLRCEQLTGEKPWSEAWVMGYGLDEKGMKMSKSKGNAIDPLPVIENWVQILLDFGVQVKLIMDMTLDVMNKKLNQQKNSLVNYGMFQDFCLVFQLLNQESCPTASDEWILSELDKLVKECKKGYEEYNFFIPAIAIREFTWNIFAAHYIEMVKARAYGIDFSDEERDGAIFTLAQNTYQQF